MKPFFLIIVVFAFSCVDKNKQVVDLYVQTQSDGLKIINDVVFVGNTTYRGFLFSLYPSGDTASIAYYENGLQEGVSKKWYANKQLMEERYYQKGKKHGKQTTYWDNGNKKFEFTAAHDINEGEMREWAFDGKLFHLANFVNGQEEGVQKMWYNNGKIKANYVVLKGKRYGLLGTKNCKNVSDSIFMVK